MSHKKLKKQNYIDILNFYNIPIPKTLSNIKTRAHNILSRKLCKCLKKLEPKFKSAAIGICSKTIITKKGFSRGNFTCKKKPKIEKLLIKKN